MNTEQQRAAFEAAKRRTCKVQLGDFIKNGDDSYAADYLEQQFKGWCLAYFALSAQPVSAGLTDVQIEDIFYKVIGAEGFAVYEVTPGYMISFGRALLSRAQQAPANKANELVHTYIRALIANDLDTARKVTSAMVNYVMSPEGQPAAAPVSEQTTPWVSVKDRLPKERGPYLVYQKSFPEQVRRANFGTSRGWDNGRDKETHPENRISHWMPLPPPPAQEQSK